MTTETIQLPIDRFRTPEGKPTCSIGRDSACRFLGSTRFGTIDICMLGGELLERDRWLVPNKSCPVWNKALDV